MWCGTQSDEPPQVCNLLCVCAQQVQEQRQALFRIRMHVQFITGKQPGRLQRPDEQCGCECDGKRNLTKSDEDALLYMHVCACACESLFGCTVVPGLLDVTRFVTRYKQSTTPQDLTVHLELSHSAAVRCGKESFALRDLSLCDALA